MDKVQFYKNLILGKIEELREDLGELRYQIYRDSVLRCEDYSQLREMADLELQMDMAKYVRDLKERLAKQGMKIEDLREEIELPELIEEDVYEDEDEELLEPEIVGDAARVYQEEISKLVGSSASGQLFDYDEEMEEDEDDEELEIEEDSELEIEEDSELEIEEDEEEDLELEIIDEEEWEEGEEEDDLAFINVKKTVEDEEEEDEEEDEEEEDEEEEEDDFETEEEDLSWLNKSVKQYVVEDALEESDFEFVDIDDIEEGGGFESASDLDFLPEKKRKEQKVEKYRDDDITELNSQRGFTPFNEDWGMDKPKIEKRKEVAVKPEVPVKKAPFDNGTDRGKKTQGMFDALNKVANSLVGVADKTKKSSMFKLDLEEDDNDDDIIKF